MKRIGNLFDQICSIDNLIIADRKASKNKKNQPGVISHNKNKEENIKKLNSLLINGKYRTSNYTTFKVFEPKERARIQAFLWGIRQLINVALSDALRSVIRDFRDCWSIAKESKF